MIDGELQMLTTFAGDSGGDKRWNYEQFSLVIPATILMANDGGNDGHDNSKARQFKGMLV
jgi:hypothetical protein